jgi:hypothetical protein
MPLDTEEVVDIPGLSGEEIIIDLCEQIAFKLRRDCNLRSSDSYVNGYSAEIPSIKIHCYGIDQADVELTGLTVGKKPEQLTEGVAKITDMETEVKVAHEPDLQAVRRRSDQDPPDVESKDRDKPADITKGAQPRRYGASKTRVAGGGAGSDTFGE